MLFPLNICAFLCRYAAVELKIVAGKSRWFLNLAIEITEAVPAPIRQIGVQTPPVATPGLSSLRVADGNLLCDFPRETVFRKPGTFERT